MTIVLWLIVAIAGALAVLSWLLYAAGHLPVR
jgi:hypothetical protein